MISGCSRLVFWMIRIWEWRTLALMTKLLCCWICWSSKWLFSKFSGTIFILLSSTSLTLKNDSTTYLRKWSVRRVIWREFIKFYCWNPHSLFLQKLKPISFQILMKCCNLFSVTETVSVLTLCSEVRTVQLKYTWTMRLSLISSSLLFTISMKGRSLHLLRQATKLSHNSSSAPKKRWGRRNRRI